MKFMTLLVQRVADWRHERRIRRYAALVQHHMRNRDPIMARLWMHVWRDAMEMRSPAQIRRMAVRSANIVDNTRQRVFTPEKAREMVASDLQARLDAVDAAKPWRSPAVSTQRSAEAPRGHLPARNPTAPPRGTQRVNGSR